MKKSIFSLFIAMTVVGIIALMQIGVSANEITVDDFNIVNGSGNVLSQLKDENTTTGVWFNENQPITINFDKTAKGIYFVWESYPDEGYVISTDGKEYAQNTGFLQEYIPFESDANTTITVNTNSNAEVLEILIVGEGELPERVHNWQAPLEKADILLLPTHADDEHLFFGSVMPTYTERGDVAIQVAYMVNHNTEPYRNQELLNGLWVAGVRNYPIIPHFPDLYSSSLAHAKTIYSAEEIIDYQIELIDRFQPQVIVAHDFAGEYGHGAHILNTDCLVQAIHQSEFQPPKVYVHLYSENEIKIDIDTPLTAFGGKTAFQVATDAFAEHRSQQRYFSVDYNGKYDLSKFGLYFSTVGADTGNDMMENIVTYEQQQIQYEEEVKRITEAALVAVNATSEACKATFEIWDVIAAEKEAQLQLELEEQKQAQMLMIIVSSAVSLAIIIVVLVVIVVKKRRR